MGVRQGMEDVRRAIQVVDFIKGAHLVDRKMVLEWAASNDSDVVGATYKAMTAHADRIRGGIQSRDISRIVMRIFELGLSNRSKTDYGFEPPDSDVLTLHYLILSWRDSRNYKEADAALRYIVSSIRRLYLDRGRLQRQRIVHGLLEHAFECPGLRSIFKSWSRHPELRKAHRDASLWGDTVEEGVLAILQQSGAVPRCCDEAPHRSPKTVVLE